MSDEVTLPGGLAPWLASRLRAETGRSVDGLELAGASRPAAGQSNDTTLFTAMWSDGTATRRRRLVLRVQPSDRQIFFAADVAREGRVIAGLSSTATTSHRVPVPHVLGVESDQSVIGRPFFVMDAVEGRVPLARPSIHLVGWLPTLSVDERRRLWDSALDVLVDVHATDWRVSHDFLLDGLDPAGALQRHVDRLVEWYRWTTRGREFPITDAGVEQLVVRCHEVVSGPPVLVWGDARVGNMIFGADHRAAAAIDWEVATIGPAAIDVGHWLFFDEFATSACGVDPLPGWPDRATTTAEYERRAGRTLADLDYFELMDEVFMATTLIRQADFRVERGLSSPDTRMGAENAVTQMLARRLGRPVPPLSPDYLDHRGLR